MAMFRTMLYSLSSFIYTILLFHSGIPAGAVDWVEECRADGFDPDRLACSTCEHVFSSSNADPASKDHSHYQHRCQDCCQSWLDTPRITRPFAAAVLIVRGSNNDELSQFLDQDWETVVAQTARNAKKNPPRLYRIDMSTSEDDSSNPYASLFRRSKPSQLLLFDAPTASSSHLLGRTAVAPKRENVPDLQKAAQDKFNLQGLKKDDIKDMILTLLPRTAASSTQ